MNSHIGVTMAKKRVREIPMIWLLAAFAFAAVAGIAVYTYVALDQGAGQADPNDTVLVARGTAVYGEQCAACHGERLEGAPGWRGRNTDGTLPPPPHDESGHTWHHPDQQLFELVKLGGGAAAPPGFVSAMPAFQDELADGDIWAVLAFIKSRWPEDIRGRQAEATRRAAAGN